MRGYYGIDADDVADSYVDSKADDDKLDDSNDVIYSVSQLSQVTQSSRTKLSFTSCV